MIFERYESRIMEEAAPEKEEVVETPPASEAQSSEKVLLLDERSPRLRQDQLAEWHSRWEEIQVHFVDDPLQSVERADQLISSVVQTITSSITDEWARIADQWSNRDGEASTEGLRQVLREYRSFFNELEKM